MTANDVITRALRLLGVNDPTEAPTAEDGALGLSVLNEWIDALGVERQSVYVLTRTAHTLTASTASYSIGTGGAINIVRPVWIDHAGLILDTSAATPTEIPIRVLQDDERSTIVQKTLTSSLTKAIWYDHAWSAGLGLIYVYPIPTVGTTQLVLYTPTALTEFADQSTDYTFPPAYRRAIVWNLANELAPYYPAASPDARLGRVAAETLANVKRANTRLRGMPVDVPLAFRGTMTRARFESGGF